MIVKKHYERRSRYMNDGGHYHPRTKAFCGFFLFGLILLYGWEL